MSEQKNLNEQAAQKIVKRNVTFGRILSPSQLWTDIIATLEDLAAAKDAEIAEKEGEIEELNEMLRSSHGMLEDVNSTLTRKLEAARVEVAKFESFLGNATNTKTVQQALHGIEFAETAEHYANIHREVEILLISKDLVREASSKCMQNDLAQARADCRLLGKALHNTEARLVGNKTVYHRLDPLEYVEALNRALALPEPTKGEGRGT